MPKLSPFKLERYFVQHEFKARYLLSASDCEALTLQELLALADADSRALWEQLSLGYTESQGLPLLRQEIAQLYSTISPEQILVAAPEEGIFIAMHTLLEPGDHVIVMTPVYQSLAEIARSMECDVTGWPVIAHGNGWRLDLDQLARCFTPRTKMLVINFPHNPTGYLPTLAEFEALLNLARQHDVIVFSDEMYRLLEFDPAQRLPSVCDVYPKGVVLSGLSKSFALPGLRMGWLVTHQSEWLDRWLAFKDYTTICHSAPSEVLAVMALRAKAIIVARNLQIVQANAALAAEFCAQHTTWFRWLQPLAGSIAFPQWLGPKSVEAWCETALNERGVMIVPGSMFEATAFLAEGNQHFRLGLGRRNFPHALEQARQCLPLIM